MSPDRSPRAQPATMFQRPRRLCLLGGGLAAAIGILATGCDAPGTRGSGAASKNGPGGAGAGASASAATRASATVARARDDTPPWWLPPGYTEIPWARAEELIRARTVDRVLATQTRRAYVIERTGEKHFTIEPRHGDLLALVAEVDDHSFLHYIDDEIPWREAEAHVREGRAVSLGLCHFRTVYVTLKGGSRFLAIAPEKADLNELIKVGGKELNVTVE